MSVVEYNLLSNKKSVPMYQAAGSGEHADTQQKRYERDIFRRIRTKDVCRVARQLATLLRAGMPLVPALSALVEQLRGIRAKDNPLAEIIEQVANDVNSGNTLADALSKHPNVFSNLFVNMVAAGETSGTLEEVLLRLAEILEKRVHLAAKVKSAIAYPLMMIVVAVGVVVFLMSVVVPGITAIFVEMNRPLPWPTRFLISTSAFIKTYLVLIAILVCAAFFGIVAGYTTKNGRLFADRTKLKLPLFGKLFLKLEIARLTRTLGILLVSGIPILSALEIAKQVIQNSFIAGALDSVKDLVSKGDNIANAIRRTGLFPPIVFHIIATGQISGDIEGGLINIADMYDGEVELTTKTLTSLLEPVILLFMGAVVAFIVMAVLLPIFDINQAL
ncbi:MAG TPA: type II secretion system F family protein [Sedimentisphaerales bacterium]|nr:type II secretion system F family protein [Sedimentisphaerales bacterium]